MTVQRFISPALHDGGFVHGAQVRAQSLVFTAGLSPLDDEGHMVGPDDPIAQVIRTVECLDAVLADRRATRAGIVKLTAYVATADRGMLGTVWHALDTQFGSATPPALVVGVTALPYPGQLVEIEAVIATEPT